MAVATQQASEIRVQVPRSPRRRMAFKGTFETVGNRGTVAVRNVSCTGAMFEGEKVPAPGRQVVLHAAGMEFFGTVIWSDGCRCGIRFDEPLAPAQVLELHRITPERVRSEELNAAADWFRSQGYCAPL